VDVTLLAFRMPSHLHRARPAQLLRDWGFSGWTSRTIGPDGATSIFHGCDRDGDEALPVWITVAPHVPPETWKDDA
jgi:hypothetical protein